MKSCSDFDPLPFLSPFSGAAYLEPRLLKKKVVDTDVKEHAASQQAARQGGRRKEVLAYLKQWDHHSRLRLLPWSHAKRVRPGSLFGVCKDKHTQRIVFNRILKNLTEHAFEGLARVSPSGRDLRELDVPQVVCRLRPRQGS